VNESINRDSLSRALSAWDEDTAFEYIAEAGGFSPASSFLRGICSGFDVPAAIAENAMKLLRDASKRYLRVPICKGMVG